jgi:phage host-nuclease inhibitor protein Gam
MKKIQLLKMADNPNLIPGIYNYCDRWCERCAFTRRCLTHKMEQEMFPNQESRDLNNGKFWEGLHRSFNLTIELLNEYAKEQGLDPDEIDLESEKENREEKRVQADESPAAKEAKKYSTMVTEWMDRHEDYLKEKEKVLTREFEHGIAGPEATAASITDALEVIRWYQMQITVKLVRALEGVYEENEIMEDEEMNDIPKDSDGSAKVALIGIDRSVGAWGELQKHFPEQSDSIMNILVHMSNLRANIEGLFPHARRFVRPGFDQEV